MRFAALSVCAIASVAMCLGARTVRAEAGPVFAGHPPSANVSPSPCPSASLDRPPDRARPPARAAAPAPCPSAPPKTIGHVTSVGRSANLVGSADAASEGTISALDIADRPILRPGELLEAIPGLVISQHSGEGKPISITCAASNSITERISKVRSAAFRSTWYRTRTGKAIPTSIGSCPKP